MMGSEVDLLVTLRIPIDLTFMPYWTCVKSSQVLERGRRKYKFLQMLSLLSFTITIDLNLNYFEPNFFLNFQSIKEKSEQEAKEKKFSFEAANKPDNRRLNRYRDVNPYDHSRIVLHRGDVDYINANLVTVMI